MIHTVTLNPALDKTAQAPNFKLDAVTRITELRQDPGGKGINVSKVIRQLGGTSTAWAVLGGNTGRYIRETLAEQGIECRAFEVEGETRTNLKVIDPEGAPTPTSTSRVPRSAMTCSTRCSPAWSPSSTRAT